MAVFVVPASWARSSMRTPWEPWRTTSSAAAARTAGPSSRARGRPPAPDSCLRGAGLTCHSMPGCATVSFETRGCVTSGGPVTRTQQLLLDDPLWLIVAKVVVLFVYALLFTIVGSWAERRIVGRMQQRPGPNRVGPFGGLQGLADGLKLAFKEDIRPVAADRVLFPLAPVIALVPAFVALSVVPFGGEVTIFGEPTVLQLVD